MELSFKIPGLARGFWFCLPPDIVNPGVGLCRNFKRGAGRRGKFFLARCVKFFYTKHMATILFVKRASKQIKSKKSSCGFAYNFADN